jgi:hypothetical protein
MSVSKPLDKLSKVRPLTSIFHPALFLSLSQFAIHDNAYIGAERVRSRFIIVDLDAVIRYAQHRRVWWVVCSR